LALACRFITALLWVATSWQTRTASEEGRMYLSAVHNLCGQIT
jgi:hypothetical protein